MARINLTGTGPDSDNERPSFYLPLANDLKMVFIGQKGRRASALFPHGCTTVPRVNSLVRRLKTSLTHKLQFLNFFRNSTKNVSLTS